MAFKKFNECKLDEKMITVCLVKRVEEKLTKRGTTYCRVTLSDGTNPDIEANIWDKTREGFYSVLWGNKERLEKGLPLVEKGLITCGIYPKKYNDSTTYDIQGYGPAPEKADIGEFIKKAPIESLVMYSYLVGLLSPDTLYGQIVKILYEANKEKLLYASAAKSMHHDIYGGLLYHTFRMAQNAEQIAKVYPVDRDLLLAGVILHDIGKLREMDTDNLGIAEYTIDGNLFGHLFMGTEMVRDAAIGLGFDGTEEVRKLMHMVASHHGKPEWDAIKRPMFLEAELLFFIDNMDARVYQYEEEYEKLEPGTMSDNIIFGLDHRVYRPAK